MFQKKKPPQGCAAETRALAATGNSIRGIAAYFGVDVATFNRSMDENPELAESFANGRDHERQTLHNMLYRKAIDKQDTVCALFLLKCRHQYFENDRSDQSNRVQVVFNLPGAMTPEQYKTIEAVAKPKQERLIDGDN